MAAPLPIPPPGRDPRQAQPQPQPQPPAGEAHPLVPAAPITARPSVPVPAAATVPARRPRRSREDLTTRQLEISAADEAAFSVLETELGGRKALVATLAAADLNQDEGKILGLLADPQNDALSLAKLCLGNGLRIARLMKMFQAAALVKGQTKAISRVAEKLPDVAAGVMEDAIAGEKPCNTCQGFGFLPKPTEDDPHATKECPECRGKCTIYYTPDHHVREMALRLGGMLDKGGGGAKILIANQNNGGGAASDPANFDRLMAGLDSVLYGEGRARQRAAVTAPPVDGEVVE